MKMKWKYTLIAKMLGLFFLFKHSNLGFLAAALNEQ